MGAQCSKPLFRPFTNLRKRWCRNRVEPLPQHLSSSADPTPPLRKWQTRELVAEETETERGDNPLSYQEERNTNSNEADVEVDCPNYASNTVEMTSPVPQAIEEEIKGRERRERHLRRVRFLLPSGEVCGTVSDTSLPEKPNTLPPLPPLVERQTDEVTELMADIDTALSQIAQDLTHTEDMEEEDNVSLQFQELLGDEEDKDGVVFNDYDREKDVACPQPDDADCDKWSMDRFIESFLAQDFGVEITVKQETKTDGGVQSLTKKEVKSPQPDSTEYDSWNIEEFIESFLAQDFGPEENTQAAELPVAKPMPQEPQPVNDLSLLLRTLDL